MANVAWQIIGNVLIVVVASFALDSFLSMISLESVFLPFFRSRSKQTTLNRTDKFVVELKEEPSFEKPVERENHRARLSPLTKFPRLTKHISAHFCAVILSLLPLRYRPYRAQVYGLFQDVLPVYTPCAFNRDGPIAASCLCINIVLITTIMKLTI